MLYVGRPALGQPDSTSGSSGSSPTARGATRVKVQLGPQLGATPSRSSSGLRPGDQVILSDTSAWDAFDRIRLN